MMNYLYAKLKSRLPIILLILLVAVLFFTNYAPGTYLSGWDSLQTELYPTLAVKRAFFSVWEEYQSFGLVAGMAHASDLIRAVVVLTMSYFLPQSAIRYTFQMLMVATGALGMFKLLNSSGLTEEKKIFALLGSLFYILNFATIQIMFLPFEPYSISLGLLPWEIWIFLKSINKNLNLLIFFLINILATPQAYSQQIFVVYLLILSLISIETIFLQKSLQIVKRVAILFVLIFAINSFWILPQIYFLKTEKSVIKEAKINQLANDDVWYSNKDKGNLKDFLSFTGFLYERLDNQNQPLFGAWQKYRENKTVIILIYLQNAVCLVGLLSKSRYRLPFFFVYLLILVGLLTDTFPFNLINQIIRTNSFFDQIFRSPFTKFAIPYALISSYFFAFGAYTISKMTRLFGFFCLATLVLVPSVPAFQGNYISPKMKIKIPERYFAVFNYFKNIDKNKRIALLPNYTFWGWFQTKWGYDGSGFLWYGIEQPIISRTFDVWSSKSESYYWEEKSAFESENQKMLEKVFEKYSIDFLILDRSILPSVLATKAFQQNENLEKMLAQNTNITLEKKWNFISIYKINHQKKIKDFVWMSTPLPNIGPEIKVTNNDHAYQNNGDYQTDKSKPYQAFYPFLDLTTQKRLKDAWEINETNANWFITRTFPFDFNDYNFSSISKDIDVTLYKNDTAAIFIIPFYTFGNKNLITAQFPKILINSFKLNADVKNCGKNKGKGGIACFGFEDKNLEQQEGYIIKIKNKNIEGQRLFFYILDKTKDQPYTEDRLFKDTQYYVVAPKFRYGMGFSFNFQNISYKNIPSTNKLNELSVYLLPYDQLKQLVLIRKNDLIYKAQPLAEFESRKIQYFLYKVLLSPTKTQNSFVILNQSFSEGWKAYEIKKSVMLNLFQHPSSPFWQILKQVQDDIYTIFPFLFGTELKDHVLVNNWSNGWTVDNYTLDAKRYTLIIVFLPQYLEFLGFLLLLASIILTFRHYRAS